MRVVVHNTEKFVEHPFFFHNQLWGLQSSTEPSLDQFVLLYIYTALTINVKDMSLLLNVVSAFLILSEALTVHNEYIDSDIGIRGSVKN